MRDGRGRMWVIVGVVAVVLVAAVGWALVRGGDADPGPAPTVPSGTPGTPSPQDGVSIHEMAPYQGDGYTIVADPVLDGSVWVSLSRPDGQVAQDVEVAVGQSVEAAGCTVTLLETHPGESGTQPGSQTGWALMRVECEPTGTASAENAAG